MASATSVKPRPKSTSNKLVSPSSSNFSKEKKNKRETDAANRPDPAMESISLFFSIDSPSMFFFQLPRPWKAAMSHRVPSIPFSRKTFNLHDSTWTLLVFGFVFYFFFVRFASAFGSAFVSLLSLARFRPSFSFWP